MLLSVFCFLFFFEDLFVGLKRLTTDEYIYCNALCFWTFSSFWFRSWHWFLLVGFQFCFHLDCWRLDALENLLFFLPLSFKFEVKVCSHSTLICSLNRWLSSFLSPSLHRVLLISRHPLCFTLSLSWQHGFHIQVQGPKRKTIQLQEQKLFQWFSIVICKEKRNCSTKRNKVKFLQGWDNKSASKSWVTWRSPFHLTSILICFIHQTFSLAWKHGQTCERALIQRGWGWGWEGCKEHRWMGCLCRHPRRFRSVLHHFGHGAPAASCWPSSSSPHWMAGIS